jgi:sulfur relay (sulfurtransferase) complex TusBCD TusD component (DsrE family)
MSVIPAASQILVPVERCVTCADSRGTAQQHRIGTALRADVRTSDKFDVVATPLGA